MSHVPGAVGQGWDHNNYYIFLNNNNNIVLKSLRYLQWGLVRRPEALGSCGGAQRG